MRAFQNLLSAQAAELDSKGAEDGRNIPMASPLETV